MKRSLAAVAVLVAALTSSATAPAATPVEKKLAALTKRVTKLEKEVKTLKTQNQQARQLAAAALTVAFCSTALTADALQGTWTAIDAFTQQSATPRALFGVQTAVNDPANTCADLEVTRTPLQANIAPFSALLALLA